MIVIPGCAAWRRPDPYLDGGYRFGSSRSPSRAALSRTRWRRPGMTTTHRFSEHSSRRSETLLRPPIDAEQRGDIMERREFLKLVFGVVQGRRRLRPARLRHRSAGPCDAGSCAPAWRCGRGPRSLQKARSIISNPEQVRWGHHHWHRHWHRRHWGWRRWHHRHWRRRWRRHHW